MQPKIIFSSTNDDEELLIPFASEVRAEHLRNERFRISEKPPSCFCCCNTRIGCYMIAALQVAFGLCNLIYAGGQLTSSEFINSKNTDEEMYMKVNILTLGLYALAVISSGLMLFHGLSFNKGRLFKPSVILTLLIIIGMLIQMAYLLLNWDQIAVKLREHLKYYCSDAEKLIANDILLDQQLANSIVGSDTDISSKELIKLSEMLNNDREELQIWQQIDTMVNDDTIWEESTKSYLMVLVGMFMTANVGIVSFIFFVLMKQMSWMKRVGQW